MSRQDRFKNKQRRDGTRAAYVHKQAERVVAYHERHPEADCPANLRQCERLLARDVAHIRIISKMSRRVLADLLAGAFLHIEPSGNGHYWRDYFMQDFQVVHHKILREMAADKLIDLDLRRRVATVTERGRLAAMGV